MYLFFDTETTGVPKNYKASYQDVDNWPRITQLAWSLYGEKGNLIMQSQNLIKPDGWKIPSVEELTRQGNKNPNFFVENNMSTERCERDGRPIAIELKLFVAVMNQAKFLIAHNINFDKAVLGAEMHRLGIVSDKKLTKFCTMMSTTQVCRIPNANGKGWKWPKLTELHFWLFKTDFEGAHDASFDVAATAKCFFELLKRNLIKVE